MTDKLQPDEENDQWYADGYHAAGLWDEAICIAVGIIYSSEVPERVGADVAVELYEVVLACLNIKLLWREYAPYGGYE